MYGVFFIRFAVAMLNKLAADQALLRHDFFGLLTSDFNIMLFAHDRW